MSDVGIVCRLLVLFVLVILCRFVMIRCTFMMASGVMICSQVFDIRFSFTAFWQGFWDQPSFCEQTLGRPQPSGPRRTPLATMRCLTPGDGFYEWKKIGPKEKQPYNSGIADDSIFAFAGLGPLEGCWPASSNRS